MAEARSDRLRVLELYCGIGGCATALGTAATPVAAIDINRIALEVYRHNYPHPTVPSLIESIPVDRWRRWDADLWWMSPPCQPFTRRGLRRDLDDPRAETLLVVLERIAEVRPRYVAFENVPGFSSSRARGRLLATLERAGYDRVDEHLLCPTDFGIPNRRQRYYLVAARGRLGPLSRRRGTAVLGRYLDPDPPTGLDLEPEVLERYRDALHLVRADDPTAVTHCFTSAYGRSPVRSGSYLATATGARRFSPAEILRLLGFPASYRLPPDLPLGNAWRLVANSLSIVAIRAVLATLPELRALAGDSESPAGETSDGAQPAVRQ